MDLDFVSAHAGRPATGLTRRDVARALLAVPSGVALVAMPDLRRAMLAVGNPLSVTFWESARSTLSAIESGKATVGEVQRWLEATGSEPILLTPSYFVWPEEDERGPVAEEMHARFVTYLEERIEAGEIDPDLLARGDTAARTAYEELQERWLNTPLPDGRVPSVVVSDEQDEELFAAWDEEEAYALAELRRILSELPQRPELPEADLRLAAARLREMLAFPGYPGNVLRACAGFEGGLIPDDDRELWLAVVAGIAGPISDLDDDGGEEDEELEEELSHEEAVLAALCAIHHADWLAAVAALARLGPGVLASPERIARLIAESEDITVDMDDPDDLDTTETLFTHVAALWAYLGIVDEDDVLTPLGWWGLPQALERAWSPDD
ncbi:hypothetical protein [Nonomuraea dietziae]|uniref:Uncharacterized protein n=1 Tax=Nonomuraea dietziae TaxID=65515 RepID=A0A7W5VE95_9ACTN|nr:hypothetical protein [Nonomuraea dietziae]MBB3730498.1 hypothetical protein [Nonomuraea dietziae]